MESIGFILGMTRSGTTWVSEWLKSHNDVSVIEEERMIYNLWKIIRNYQLQSIGRDFITLAYKHIANEKQISIEKMPGYMWWDNIISVNAVNTLLPGCKHLILTRDGRNWIYSALNYAGNTQDMNINSAITMWNKNAKAIALIKNEKNVLIIKYEDLVKNPSMSFQIASHFGINNPNPLIPWTRPINTHFTSYDENRWKKLGLQYIPQLRAMNKMLEELGYDPI